MLNMAKAQQIMGTAIKRLVEEAGMTAQHFAIREIGGDTSMIMVVGVEATVEKTIFGIDPVLLDPVFVGAINTQNDQAAVDSLAARKLVGR